MYHVIKARVALTRHEALKEKYSPNTEMKYRVIPGKSANTCYKLPIHILIYMYILYIINIRER